MSQSHGKPQPTATAHVLPYEQLSPRDFERLCLGLVTREGYDNAEHLGASGGEQGRDIQAERAGERVIFQCKRVKSFGPPDARKEVDKILGLPPEKRPVELIFLVTCNVSVQTRDAARERSGEAFPCTFWAYTELDEKVRRYPELVQQFFHAQAGDQSRSVFDQRGQTVQGPQTNLAGEVKAPVFSGTFQGPVQVESGRQIQVGDIHASGGTVNIAGGDVIQNTVNDQSIHTGDITGSTGVAIGHGAQATVTQSSDLDAQAIARAFAALQKRVEQLPGEDQQEDARDALKKLEAEALKGEQPNESRVRKWLDFLAGMSGDIFEVAVATFTNPLNGLSLAFRKIAERAKEERAGQG